MFDYQTIPSGKFLHSYGLNHHLSWENSLFPWPVSIALAVITRGYRRLNDKTPETSPRTGDSAGWQGGEDRAQAHADAFPGRPRMFCIYGN